MPSPIFPSSPARPATRRWLPRAFAQTRSGRRPRGRDRAGAGLALQPGAQRQRRPRRAAVARAPVRLGGRRPVLRPQRLPDGPARPAERRAPAGSTVVGSRPAAAAPLAGPLLLPRRAGPRRGRAGGRPISGRTPCTCRTTRGRRWRTCGRSRSRSTSTSCSPSSSRFRPARRLGPRLLVGVLVAVLVGSLALRGVGVATGVERGAAAVAHPLPHGRAGGRGPARRPQRARPERLRAARRAGGGCGRPPSPPASLPRHLRQDGRPRRARSATPSRT